MNHWRGIAVGVACFIGGWLLSRRVKQASAAIGKERWIIWASFGGWFLVAIGVLIAIGFAHRFDWSSNEALSQLGSFFQGTVVAAWTLAAFLFAYVAFLQQRQQMAEQREQLSRTEGEMRLQARIAARERFEHTFFELVKLHHSLVNDLQMIPDAGGPPIEGRACFREIYNALQRIYKSQGATEPRQRLEAAYEEFYAIYQPQIGHYFRNLYHIVRFVETSRPDENKATYIKILRAQLSSEELLLLFYNGLSPVGRVNFKLLIERFGLLEGVPPARLLSENHFRYYDTDAFADKYWCS